MEISLENTSFIEEEGTDYNEMLKKILKMGNNDVLVFKNINLGLFLQYIQLKYKDNRGTLIHANEKMISEYKSKYLIEQQITEALAEDRVEVFMQPIYSIHERRFTSAEALVRIRKKDGELLPPGMFIPVAEENGQIMELGERVFEKVCEINLSVVQCDKTYLSERLISIIKKNEIEPDMINLEITETATIEAQKILLMNMSQLIKEGFTFWPKGLKQKKKQSEWSRKVWITFKDSITPNHYHCRNISSSLRLKSCIE